jgi:nitrogen PTS system EIIA component
LNVFGLINLDLSQWQGLIVKRRCPLQLTVRDVAGIFNISETTVFNWIKHRNLPVYHVDEEYRFSRSELLEWASTTQTDVTSEIINAAPGQDPLLMPRLDEALQAGGVNYGVGGTDKTSVLDSVVQALHLPMETDRSFLYQVLLSRESLGSTGIGDGIAIPHVRNPIVLQIPSSMISLCYLEQAVDFGALDGQPVSILFTLISPTVRTHLNLLSKLSFALSDAQFKTIIKQQASRNQIIAEALRIEEKLPAH